MKHVKIRRSSAFARRCLSDDRGVATLEGIFVYLGLTLVLLGVLLLGQWAQHLQRAQMGARLLTFNAGDLNLAKFGRPGDHAETTFTRDSVAWSSYAAFDVLPVNWFNALFVLHNDRRSGRVRSTPRQSNPLTSVTGSSLFDFSLAALGYNSGSSTACNAWDGSEADARSKFLSISYSVGRTRVHPQGLTSAPPIPASIPLLETVYTRVGGIR